MLLDCPARGMAALAFARDKDIADRIVLERALAAMNPRLEKP